MLDIQNFSNIASNDIVAALAAKLGESLLAAKFHFTRGKQNFVEMVFQDKTSLQKHASEGI
ncbi:6482_t:CDS:1, partial [Cetraspora pellucida]